MFWKPLSQFRDPAVPKLDNLRRAESRGLRVPPTVWASGADLEMGGNQSPPPEMGSGPWIIRSGSPTEDTRETSNAGQLLSLPVHSAPEFAPSLARVVAALPQDSAGRRLGVAFVQPLVAAEEAGVAFFDGFYYERTQARGGNEALTSGQSRGETVRSHLARGDAWSGWLSSVYAVFGSTAGARADGDPRIDIEFARDAQGYVLLQVRPALFPVLPNPTLSLANHKEILGDPPSPWMVSALVRAGQDLSFPALADPTINTWNEAYAVEAGERAWMNVSFWFRWMDHFGMPRTTVTEGVGGEADGPADGRLLPGRFLRSIPNLVWFQLCCLGTIPGLSKAFRKLDQTIGQARTLSELHAATVDGLRLALRGNFAINAALSGIRRVRRVLHIPGTARVVTQQMMDEYRRLVTLPVSSRESELSTWLERYGHRGPLESDLSRPRFRELQDVLLSDLTSSSIDATSTTESTGSQSKASLWTSLFRPAFWLDERREWFRDEMMKRWERIRTKILAEGARLKSEGAITFEADVFWLRAHDLNGSTAMAELVEASKARVAAVQHVELPSSAPRDVILDLLAKAEIAQAKESGRRVFPGIALTSAVVTGRAVVADDLLTLLKREQTAHVLGPETILVVPTLEPSWAVVFPRVGGVVAELGGELSHASILLREAQRPAMVNCAGIFREIVDGQQLRLDGARGVVEIVNI